MLDADKARLIKTGTVHIGPDLICIEGFEGEGTSCRELAVLATVWAIGQLQLDLQAQLQEPGGGRSAVD